MTDGATQYGHQPTDPRFIEACPTINNWIRAVVVSHRDRFGHSLEDLSKLTGVPRPMISNWQRTGGHRPRSQNLVRFCLGLDLDPDPVLRHFGYIAAPGAVRARKVKAAIDAIEEVLADPDLPAEERREYEHQTLLLLELATGIKRNSQ
ncbi:helix-turn-helix transcriptional regulator [Glycomyces sp. YM15]|uniref:helix-turn-helix domain-containing protein n=1 Tax=Glycomyces sp. YM15 TaxID=2800446 RepID=UPI00196629FA|nr:helix-turn-helix transcriptional regulator [Glycomyces sp. YM15]